MLQFQLSTVKFALKVLYPPYRKRLSNMKKVFKLIASGEAFARFRPKLKLLLKQSNLNEKKASEVLLGAQEVLTNILKHGYKGKPSEIRITFKNEPDQISITTQDFGERFDLTRCEKPKLPRTKPGGLGIFLIKASFDEVEYSAQREEGNLIRLTKFKKTEKIK
jgi:anti-sigma regulatory factor (Ser/Thr protein kinase)